jgi:nitroimidazol reductase NimA-like FMN-containing flavoprotein (pyridoxamine 5'-phosphate oxidase superfamily)
VSKADRRKTFKNSELKFLKSQDVARLATATKQGVPQVTPVVYAMDGGNFIIATDYKTQKLKNLTQNPKASLVVDVYNPNKGIFVLGDCEILERGPEYLRLLKVLFKRFDFYRKNPWGEGESPILKVVPSKVASWGFK